MNETSSTAAATIHKNGVRREFQILEKEVWNWALEEKQTHGKLPSKKLIQEYALEKYHQAGHHDFKASLGWYRRWEKRYDLKKIRTSDVKSSGHSSPKEKHPSTKNKLPPDTLNCLENMVLNNDGIFLNQTLDSFSCETDRFIGNIDMIDSPSEFFNFSDSFGKSMDSDDIHDSDTTMRNFMKELIDDFGKYFSDEKSTESSTRTKLNKKSCKYDDDFKEKVIHYINENCIKEAAKKFSVHPNTISVWMKENDFHKHLTEIIIKTENIQNDEAIKKEEEFLDWLEENEKNNIIVSKSQVKNKISHSLLPGEINGNTYWFLKYCHRYINGNEADKTLKIRYSDQFQKLMVNYANKTSQIKTASVFNLARKQLFNWMKNIRSEKIINRLQADEKLLQWYDSCDLKPHSKVVREKAKMIYFTEGADITCSYTWYYNWCAKNKISVKRNCDEEIVQWILEAYDQNTPLSHQDVQEKATEIYHNHMEGDFKASPGWLLRFCRRYMNLLRRIPPLSISLPAACEKNVEIFRQHVFSIKSKHNIDSNSFGIMDEFFLRLKPLRTVDSSNKKTLLRTCGMNNIQGTVLLACLANGCILPPVLILKDKNIGNESKDCIVLNQTNGIVDDDVLSHWLEKIWFKHVKSPNILLLDCFDPHDSVTMREYFTKENSFMEIIPKGCSSKLNPIIQIIAPSFQRTIDENCKKWFDTNNFSWQIGGSSSLLSSDDIISWVEKAYECVNTSIMMENVERMFEKMNLISMTQYEEKF